MMYASNSGMIFEGRRSQVTPSVGPLNGNFLKADDENQRRKEFHHLRRSELLAGKGYLSNA
jgi:hypothetical protein